MPISIDLNLPKAEFKKLIEAMIQASREAGTAMPLPVPGGMPSLALVLSQVNCEGCGASCCRVSNFGIPLTETAYEKLVERLGKEKVESAKIKSVGKIKYLPTPCPFLKKNVCSVYDVRPLVCALYPQQQAEEGSLNGNLQNLDPTCPEARRIVKRAWLALWELNNKRKVTPSELEALREADENERSFIEKANSA